jgi:hypothetical protein
VVPAISVKGFGETVTWMDEGPPAMPGRNSVRQNNHPPRCSVHLRQDDRPDIRIRIMAVPKQEWRSIEKSQAEG